MAGESRPKNLKWVFCGPTKYAYGMRVVVISGHCERECFLLRSCFLPCSRRQSRIPRKTSRMRTFILGLFCPLGICVCLRGKGRKYKRVGQKCALCHVCAKIMFVLKCRACLCEMPPLLSEMRFLAMFVFFRCGTFSEKGRIA